MNYKLPHEIYYIISGNSALTDLKRGKGTKLSLFLFIYFTIYFYKTSPLAEYKFYTEDCHSVGVPPSQDWGDNYRPLDPLNIPNFNKPNRGFLHDERLQKLSFRVANITDYLENEETLVDHIKQERL